MNRPHASARDRRVWLSTVASMMLAGAAAGCGSEPAPDEVIEPAERATRFLDGPDSAQLGGPQNQSTCYTCHTGDGTQLGFCGNTLKNLGYHDAWMGGDATSLLDATNMCVEGWMGGDALSATSEAYKSIEAYILSQSDPSETAVTPIMPDVKMALDEYEADYAGGDPMLGVKPYLRYCGLCHDVGLVVGAHAAPELQSFSNMTVGRIAQKVRTSGPPPSTMGASVDETPGPMPFFEEKDLSSADLRSIIAFIRSQ